MKTFLLTAPSFGGEIEFKYSLNGLLAEFNIRAQLTDEQHKWILKNIALTPSGLEIFKQNKIKVSEVVREIDFAIFWERWFAGRQKDNSSKKRAEAKFNKMPKAEQIKAFNYIAVYMNNIPQGTPPKYGETYLNAELWNN